MKTPGQPPGQVIPMQKPPEEVYFAMAAATMDSFGKLFEPEPEMPFLRYIPVGGGRGKPAEITRSLREDGNTKDQAAEKVQRQMKKEGIDLEDVPGS